MRPRLVFNLLLPLCIAGCYYRETAATHIVHAGDNAVLAYGTRTEVPLALSRNDTHLLARTVDAGDDAALQALIASGRAVLVPANTAVVVTRESFNERYVDIREGPQAGKRGWVPFEWLHTRRDQS